MSDPLRPHGLQPSRLLSPWDFPGKNSGVGCQVLLQMIVYHLHIFTSEVIFLQNLEGIPPLFLALLFYLLPGVSHSFTFPSSDHTILKLPQHVGERHISPEPISINICWVMPGWKDGWTDGWMHKLVPGCMVNDCYGQSPVLQLPRGGRTTESSSWLQGWAQLFLASYSLRHKGSQSGVSGPLDGL